MEAGGKHVRVGQARGAVPHNQTAAKDPHTVDHMECDQNDLELVARSVDGAAPPDSDKAAASASCAAGG